MSAVIKATTDMKVRDSNVLKSPVISVIRIMPVIGALTIAAKYPAIPIITKHAMYSWPTPRVLVSTLEYRPPVNAPRTSRGRKIPPGDPDPKLAVLNKNFSSSRVARAPRANFPELISATIMLPLPRTSGFINMNRKDMAMAQSILKVVLLLGVFSAFPRKSKASCIAASVLL